MRIQDDSIWFDIAAELVDETLIEASRSASSADRERFLREREAVASIETIDIREDAFRAFDTEWIDRFGILEPLRNLVARNKPQGCVLRRVKSADEQRARANDNNGERVVYLQVLPKTVLSRAALERLIEDLTSER